MLLPPPLRFDMHTCLSLASYDAASDFASADPPKVRIFADGMPTLSKKTSLQHDWKRRMFNILTFVDGVFNGFTPKPFWKNANKFLDLKLSVKMTNNYLHTCK
jgi:hypothetical protein